MEPKEILIKAREKKGFTQKALAQRLKIEPRTLQRYEEGKFPKFKNDTIKDIDAILGTTLYDIIYDNNFPRGNRVSELTQDENLNGNDIVIELKTATGKTLVLAAEGKSDMQMLGALIEEKEARRQEATERAKFMENEALANLTAMMKLLERLERHDMAYHETMLRSLARLEKKTDTNVLIEEADISAAEQQHQDLSNRKQSGGRT